MRKASVPAHAFEMAPHWPSSSHSRDGEPEKPALHVPDTIGEIDGDSGHCALPSSTAGHERPTERVSNNERQWGPHTCARVIHRAPLAIQLAFPRRAPGVSSVTRAGSRTTGRCLRPISVIKRTRRALENCSARQPRRHKAALRTCARPNNARPRARHAAVTNRLANGANGARAQNTVCPAISLRPRAAGALIHSGAGGA